MRLYFVQPIVKQINKDYQQIQMSKDLPFELEDLKFIRTYKNLENVFEVKQFEKHLEDINQRLNDDYQTYSNDTHLNFNSIYYDYKACLKVLELFKQALPYPEIEYNKDELTILSKTITEIVNDQISYLNIKYKEFYFSYLEEPFIKLLKNQFDKVMDVTGTFADVIKFMCEFNIQYYKFKNQQKDLSDDERIIKFLDDCLRTSDTFSMVLRIYFKFMIENNYSDDNMINYSHSYLAK